MSATSSRETPPFRCGRVHILYSIGSDFKASISEITGVIDHSYIQTQGLAVIFSRHQVCVKTNQRLSRACIVHLVIKRTNWSYVKTMSCSGSHLGITINIKNTKFVKNLPMIDAQFRFNQCNSFREYISVFSQYGPVLIL
jgi:hypothetical protein